MREPRLLYAALTGFGLVLCVACHESFEFDVPAAAAGLGGTPGGAGSAGGDAGTAGGGTTSGGGGTAGGLPSEAGTSGVAEACGQHGACPSGLHCADGECRACASDADCAPLGLKRCDLTRYRCIECITTSDCSEGFRCDALGNKCLMACAQRSDCPATAHGCNASRGVCYECDEDRECARSESGPLCALDGSGCVACRDHDDCGDLLCDTLTGQCVECRDGLDCASGLCEPLEHVCLAELGT